MLLENGLDGLLQIAHVPSRLRPLTLRVPVFLLRGKEEHHGTFSLARHDKECL